MSTEPGLSRRTFLASAGTGALGFAAASRMPRRGRTEIPGSVLGANRTHGHRMRDGQFPRPSHTEKAPVVVVGGGIAGLAAARQLRRHGFHEFILLELEDQLGGNARAGQNDVSAFPWGAHYIPLPSTELKEIIGLFEELGVITGRNADGLPIYREEFLCADPAERLFLHGRWQEGLIPQMGVTAGEQRQIDAFLRRMNDWRHTVGRDHRPAFSLPVDASSQDPDILALDRQTMSDYLRTQGWNAGPLRWYVDYCCRDDYGAGSDIISAWAGIHYFAARRGRAANAPGHTVLTWPEGNGWVVDRLRAGLDKQVRSGCTVWNIEPEDGTTAVDYHDQVRDISVRIRADAVVFAAPRFVADRIIAPLRGRPPGQSSPGYSPWMVANLTLDRLPEGDGAPLAWDNVLYKGRSLGYVTATHQHLHPFPKRTVLTYYQPLDHTDPVNARTWAMGRSHADWTDTVFTELAAAHPGLRRDTRQLDVWIWAHAMARPLPGWIWSRARREMAQPFGNIHFAHSDMGGLSLFEEAFHHGFNAGNTVVQRLRRTG